MDHGKKKKESQKKKKERIYEVNDRDHLSGWRALNSG